MAVDLEPQTGERASPADLGRLVDRYRAVREWTARLAADLSPEDCQIQSMPDASPVKWHLAHSTWFFETFVLGPHATGYRTYHPSFSFLYNSYYNAIGDRVRRDKRGLMSRPSLDEVRLYRAAVDAATIDLIESASNPTLSAIEPLVTLGLNHEQQHQELILTDLKHALAQNPLRPAYRERGSALPATVPPPMGWVGFPGGLGWFGHDGPRFAFDNESPRHQAFVHPFQLATRAVTSGEYIQFIDDGGYRRPEFWLSDGWAAVTGHGWQAPLYWERSGDGWRQFTLSGDRPVDPGEPVTHVSFYEADAFARWAGARLPTEFEWESAVPGDVPEPEPDANLAESGQFHPRSTTKPGLTGLLGDVWEWTMSPYGPYPGLRPVDGALGEYNAKFMCNQLVLRGGSCATPRSHIRASYRNFFPADARWQFSGIRLARDP